MKIVLEFDSVDELRHFTAHWYEHLIPKRVYRNEIEDLQFTVRTAKCLKDEGITTVDELCNLTERDVLKIPNLGRRNLDEIKTALALRGREFAR